ncbi:phosphatase PAP2 family protein [Tabrizicola sp. J26]|uniref:phosphatase PAP2 family protein n=1 Tax=Alitabrizicola rongguiensis TaxID=2909234 RepID=UPI001F15CD4D|nr:phosphatase PAP2 family protein [Tabrizicola rongguiensis]MCF1707998.1 phosphatase PAP2 family protein [Tabrizicola rongguiensis]
MRRDRLQIVAVVVMIVFAFVFFAVWPGIDPLVTAFFQDPSGKFLLAGDGLANDVRLGLWRLSEAMLGLALVALLAAQLTRKAILGVPKKVWAYIVLLYLLGPALLADTILKRVWGRARPADIVEFGGTLQFTPPHQFSGQCHSNCSFVSGEVSGAVALAISLLVLLEVLGKTVADGSRRTLQFAILLLPVLVAAQRIAAGRHFLSDTIFAALVTVLVALLLRIWLLPRSRT